MDPVKCEECGGENFVQGRMGNGTTSVRPIDKLLSGGSFLLFTFCSECGTVSSIKVEKPDKFK